MIRPFADLELPDKGKQTKSVHVWEWFRPKKFVGFALEIARRDEGVVKMRDSCDVPRVTGQGTCKETAGVIDQMGNDHFDDLLGKSHGGGLACRGRFWRSTSRTYSPDSSEAPVPSSHPEQPNDCG